MPPHMPPNNFRGHHGRDHHERIPPPMMGSVPPLYEDSSGIGKAFAAIDVHPLDNINVFYFYINNKKVEYSDDITFLQIRVKNLEQ